MSLFRVPTELLHAGQLVSAALSYEHVTGCWHDTETVVSLNSITLLIHGPGVMHVVVTASYQYQHACRISSSHGRHSTAVYGSVQQH